MYFGGRVLILVLVTWPLRLLRPQLIHPRKNSIRWPLMSFPVLKIYDSKRWMHRWSPCSMRQSNVSDCIPREQRSHCPRILVLEETCSGDYCIVLLKTEVYNQSSYFGSPLSHRKLVLSFQSLWSREDRNQVGEDHREFGDERRIRTCEIFHLFIKNGTKYRKLIQR